MGLVMTAPGGEKLSKEEQKWRAEMDANVLADAEAIKNDEKRRDAALKALKKLIAEKKQKMDAMKKVVSGKK